MLARIPAINNNCIRELVKSAAVKSIFFIPDKEEIVLKPVPFNSSTSKLRRASRIRVFRKLFVLMTSGKILFCKETAAKRINDIMK